MLRRILTGIVVLAAAVAGAVLTAASSGESTGKAYKAEFDNAFGLVEGGDLRIGGVNAGQTTGFDISESEPVKAVVEFQISEPGFDSLREDARCEARQQSLIGEYYVDCQPGTSDTELPDGGTIPVEQTASIIPADLVNNVLREPYRERLRLIIAELGTGLAGRPEDLAETIRRAHPGLRETNEVLGILEGQTDVLRDFVSDSDAVVDDLAANRDDVVRFVQEAEDTASISATRKEDLADQFEKLPTFLAELDPTMVELGQLADAQIPLLADLRLASDDLNRFFTELGPFSEASRPALRSLGDASIAGRRAIDESRNEIRELRRVAAGAGDVGEPLRQFLQVLDSRERAITTDLRTPEFDPPRFDRESLQNPRNRGFEARGFTGMEGLLNFVFFQALTTSGFDGVSHFLRILGVVDESAGPSCSPLGNAQPDRETLEKCNSFLGPNQPGSENATGTFQSDRFRPPQDFGPAEPDFTERIRRQAGGTASDSGRQASREEDRDEGRQATAAQRTDREDPTDPSGGLTDEVRRLIEGMREDAARADRDEGDAGGPAGEAPQSVEGLLGGAAEDEAEDDLRSGTRSGGASAPAGPATDDMLLDFLLGP